MEKLGNILLPIYPKFFKLGNLLFEEVQQKKKALSLYTVLCSSLWYFSSTMRLDDDDLERNTSCWGMTILHYHSPIELHEFRDTKPKSKLSF